MLLELAKTKLALGKKKPADLINLPEMKDEKMIAAINLMMLCIPVSIAVNPFVTSIFTLKVVALSLKYGITPMAAIAFAVYSSIESSNLGLIRSGIEFGELAKKIADKSGSKYIKSVVYFNNYFTIMHFRIGLKDNIGYMKKVIPTCIEVGNTEYMGLIYSFIPLHYFTSGIPLDVVDREMLQKYKKNIYNLKQPQTTMCYDVNAYCIYTMRGDTDSITALNRNYLEYTDTIIEKYKEANNDMYLASFYVAEVVIQYILNEYDQALDYALKAEVIIDSLFGSPFIQTFNFYYTMVLLVLYPEVGSGKQRKYLKKIKSNRKHFKKLGESNPYNYLNKYYLIEAELHRVTGGDFEKIIQLYDEAITVAKEKEIYHEQAIANELAAKYCLSKEMKSIARGYMTEAFYYFNRWGAKPKADSLQQLYPELISTTGGKQFKISESMSTADSTVSDMNALDLTTIIKASNTISSEIKLRELLMKMMRIVIENAGAQKGFFLLPYKGQWFIEAEGEMNKTDIIVMKSIPAFGQDMENAVPVLPEAIINYVERTKENIVLDNALVEGKFTNDTYIMEKQPKSILCIPLVNQGTLNGILYLENNLTTGAFSEDRVEVLNTLSSQIAISIENARMYKDLDDLNKNLEVKVTDRTKELREKNIQIMNSIKYASTIQYSILPLSETINKYVSGHFALWNPRDVVGGDFYWFHEIGESFFIAVIDCTGHGVPGAFMTMIAKSVLNRIIGESSGKSPATILKDLNSIVRSTLGQDKESALSDDGMDVALCYVEPGENKIIYSGSKLPLYYCENNEVVTIKGDRQSIGYKKSREDFEYTDHEIAVQGDAVFFLSTDGYIDQLGGEKGLPFGRKRFTDTLLEIHQKSFTEVPDIMKKKIKNYRGEEPQIDDITIVGFRV
ncbi:MAG: SpoIIE family protein phosphatase [bacterium]|nr:SpoIIE family protein phosphatase [bacterium]